MNDGGLARVLTPYQAGRAGHDINASTYAHQLIATGQLLEQFAAIAAPTHHHHEEPS